MYATWFSRFGRTVHHYPERPEATRRDPEAITRTMALIEQVGHSPDPELWTGRVGQLIGVVRHTRPAAAADQPGQLRLPLQRRQR